MTRAAAIGFALCACLMWGVARSDVKSEVVEMPSICGPMRELEAMVLGRGGKWLLTGTSPAGKVFFYVNAKEGEAYILHPIGGMHCLWLERLTHINTNRDHAIGLIAD